MTSADDRERLHAITTLTCSLVELPGHESAETVRAAALRMIKHHVEDAGPLHFEFHEQDGIPSMVVTPNKQAHPDVMLLAHADVIDHGEHCEFFAERVNGRIVGPGAGDMKGQLAILSELFRTLHTRYDRPSVGLMVTTDEEVGGQAGVGHLFGNGIVNCGLVINPDGGSLNEITVMEKGVLHLRVHSQGISCHAARPWKGDNALTRLREGLTQLEGAFEGLATDPERWHPTCTVTAIHTENNSVNRVPSHATATVDIRFPAPYRLSDMRQRVEEALGPDIKVEVLMQADPAVMSPDPLFIECSSEICGQPAREARDAGASDSRYIAERGIPVIMSRPLVGNLHARDEWIDVDSMLTFYRICECYLHRKLHLTPRPAGT